MKQSSVRDFSSESNYSGAFYSSWTCSMTTYNYATQFLLVILHTKAIKVYNINNISTHWRLLDLSLLEWLVVRRCPSWRHLRPAASLWIFSSTNCLWNRFYNYSLKILHIISFLSSFTRKNWASARRKPSTYCHPSSSRSFIELINLKSWIRTGLFSKPLFYVTKNRN